MVSLHFAVSQCVGIEPLSQNEFPNYEQILDALVDGSLGTIQVNAPSTGWPSGSGFQINLVQDSQHLDTLLAQSDDFSFHAPASSSVSGSSTVSGASTVSVLSATTGSSAPATTNSYVS